MQNQFMNKKTLIALLLIFTNVFIKSQDSAKIKHYADANSKVSPPASGEKRVVYIGDSIPTFGSITTPPFLQAKLILIAA